MLNRSDIYKHRVYTIAVAIQCILKIVIMSVTLHYVANASKMYRVMWTSFNTTV